MLIRRQLSELFYERCMLNRTLGIVKRLAPEMEPTELRVDMIPNSKRNRDQREKKRKVMHRHCNFAA